MEIFYFIILYKMHSCIYNSIQPNIYTVSVYIRMYAIIYMGGATNLKVGGSMHWKVGSHRSSLTGDSWRSFDELLILVPQSRRIALCVNQNLLVFLSRCKCNTHNSTFHQWILHGTFATDTNYNKAIKKIVHLFL